MQTEVILTSPQSSQKVDKYKERLRDKSDKIKSFTFFNDKENGMCQKASTLAEKNLNMMFHLCFNHTIRLECIKEIEKTSIHAANGYFICSYPEREMRRQRGNTGMLYSPSLALVLPSSTKLSVSN